MRVKSKIAVTKIVALSLTEYNSYRITHEVVEIIFCDKLLKRHKPWSILEVMPPREACL